MSARDQDQLAAIFRSAHDKPNDPPVVYSYRDRSYRVRMATVTFAEMETLRGEWVTLPNHVFGQLLDAISKGDAVRVAAGEGEDQRGCAGTGQAPAAGGGRR